MGTKTMFATALTPPCLTVYLVPTGSLSPDLKGTIHTVTVDGLTAHINKTTDESFADIGHGYSVVVGDDPNRRFRIWTSQHWPRRSASTPT